MTKIKAKHAALESMKGLIYQAAIALKECFNMDDGHTVWVEKDGDVSVEGETPDDSKQIEAKNYSDSLTDHHTNFWKTLKNWMADGFDHTQYGALILHTTQPFGARSKLSVWNQKSAEARLALIKEIYASRKDVDDSEGNKSKVEQLEKKVCEADSKLLLELLAKVHLRTESDNEEDIIQTIKKNKLIGIPPSNHNAYLDGLVGFIIRASGKELGWAIQEKEFREKLEELTAIYCRSECTFPPFTGFSANENQVADHTDMSFVQKIRDIEHEEVIPDAVGNYLELHEALRKELHAFPQFRSRTNKYQDGLIEKFKLKHRRKKRNVADWKKESKDLYDETFEEDPPSMPNTIAPPRPYRNGLIHDAINDESKDLKWSLNQ